MKWKNHLTEENKNKTFVWLNVEILSGSENCFWTDTLHTIIRGESGIVFKVRH